MPALRSLQNASEGVTEPPLLPEQAVTISAIASTQSVRIANTVRPEVKEGTPPMPTEEFPPHDPNFPDVDPVSGDERETTEGPAKP